MDREHRRARLAQTVAWCSLLPLNGSPEESEEIKQRRQLFERSGKLFMEPHALQPKKWLSWLAARKKERLQEEAMRVLDPADAGIKVNPEECISWADNASVERIFGVIHESRLV